MNKATWLEIFLIRDGHGPLTAEPMDTQLNTSYKLLKNGKIRYINEELTSSVHKSRDLLKDNCPISISLLKEEQRHDLMLTLYLRSKKWHLKKTFMTL
jgi:hypothetical protein